MNKFIRQNIKHIKQLCRQAWEKMKHYGGAFLNNVYVDYRDGSIWYDTEKYRLCLVGYKIAKKIKEIKDKAGNLVKRTIWALEQCSATDGLATATKA
jgi:hypothetical protein